ncbi:MAG: hypothetical protein HYR63_19890 [Proteobacteria bacterium]|nr:hypothetical protein [Pseudomonadota bacterium]
MPTQRHHAVAVDLTAVVVAVTADQPRVLVVPQALARPRKPGGTGEPAPLEALPSGPLKLQHHTLDSGLRAWVGEQTHARLGHVEQLYTFGDRDRTGAGGSGADRVLSIGYLALTREAGASVPEDAPWRDWYRYVPWEDWRQGRPAILEAMLRQLRAWAAAASSGERSRRTERLGLAFGLEGAAWSDERVLERYELLYEAGLVAEAVRATKTRAARAETSGAGEPMAADHRRILATAIARLRGKIKYRPVVFELMPPGFTLLKLQRAVEALAGVRLHKQNFRRLVAQQGLVEETGRIVTATGGRPAREVRFRQEAVLERLDPGMRLSVRRGSKKTS